MPSELTEITELATALGMLSPTIDEAFDRPPAELLNVPDASWQRLRRAWSMGSHDASFRTAFANGQWFLHANDGLRGRRPLRVEWKGQHRPPGDDVIPADLRVDHVYLISCKYLSKVLLNPGPQRLFERLLVGDGREGTNWFTHVAAPEYEAFYRATVDHLGLAGLPPSVAQLERPHQQTLKSALRGRALPTELQPEWNDLCAAVSTRTSRLWDERLASTSARLKLLWRMTRVSGSTYFVLGTDSTSHIRLRIDSAWDWMQNHDLRRFTVKARDAGQPEVGWQAVVGRRADGEETVVEGHVEIRWSHGRFSGVPEAKVYLDTPHSHVPGYHRLA